MSITNLLNEFNIIKNYHINNENYIKSAQVYVQAVKKYKNKDIALDCARDVLWFNDYNIEKLLKDD